MTQTMQFTEGTPVISVDGNDLGKVDRLVIDPRRRQVSHLVLSKGFFFPEERVVPVEFVAVANDEVVALNESVELDELPRFEESHYLELDDDTARQHFPRSAAAPLVWAYPAYGAMAPASLFSRYMASPQMIPWVSRNIPDHTVAVPAGADVVASDAVDVGRVAGASVTDDGKIVSIDVDPGWFATTRTIPAHLVESIDEHTVRLSVASATLEAWRDLD